MHLEEGDSINPQQVRRRAREVRLLMAVEDHRLACDAQQRKAITTLRCTTNADINDACDKKVRQRQGRYVPEAMVGVKTAAAMQPPPPCF